MKKVKINENEIFDWLFVESGTETDGSYVCMLPNQSIRDIKKYIKEQVRYEKNNTDGYDYGTEYLNDIEIRTYNNEVHSVYGFAVFSDSHIDFEAHRLDKIEIEKKQETNVA